MTFLSLLRLLTFHFSLACSLDIIQQKLRWNDIIHIWILFYNIYQQDTSIHPSGVLTFFTRNTQHGRTSVDRWCCQLPKEGPHEMKSTDEGSEETKFRLRKSEQQNRKMSRAKTKYLLYETEKYCAYERPFLLSTFFGFIFRSFFWNN